VVVLKKVELKLIAELMKNSHRSDRELASELHVSQPTVTRTRAKLEKQGTIREYTIIPDFASLGFELMSVIFVKLTKLLLGEELENFRKTSRELMRKYPTATILALNGMGLGADRVIITYHKNYSDYNRFIAETRMHPALIVDDSKSFLVDLNDGNNFILPTLSLAANYLQKANENST
jgi:DNA-binding Lrp family transcriptional regulator